jgi:predicted alpha/beta superfamily hydrolase
VIESDQSALPDTEVHYLRSEHVGDEFKILIGHCGSSETSSPAAVFLGDPWANFGTAVEIARLLRLIEDVPPLLVVGVGHRPASLEAIFKLRARDFTPSVALGSGYTDTAMMGGADRFLAFLRDELKPWVQGRYGADPDDSTYFGDSLGGLFATHALLSEPAAFQRYGIGSPSYWWDKKMMFDREADYARSHDDLPAKVFIAVGAYETPEGDRHYLDQVPAERRAKVQAEFDAEPPVDAVSDVEQMVALLRSRGYPNLEIESEVLAGEYHHTAPPLNLSRSLRYLFGAPR